MKRRQRDALVVASLLTVAGAAASLADCAQFPTDDCESTLTCPPVDAAIGVEAAESGTGDGRSESSATGDAFTSLDASADRTSLEAAPDSPSEAPADAPRDAPVDTTPPCNATLAPHDDVCVLDDTLGVFVATAASGGSDTTGDGTRAHPYASIGKALTSLGGKLRVYVCDGLYAEQVALAAPVSLYGGLSCDRSADASVAWGYADAQATIAPGDAALPLRISDAGSDAFSIEDFAIRAMNASGQDDAGNGSSSIAVLVSGSTVAFRRCMFSAGNGDRGGPGRDGATSSNYAGMDGGAPTGFDQDGGIGGAGGATTCANGDTSRGGMGGSASGGTDGGTGTSSPPTVPADGVGGGGGTTSCGLGAHTGQSGGVAQGGAQPALPGMLTAAGWSPSPGGDGETGKPGQGGGGGGALAPMPGTGVGGTGGGSGGCGGTAGSGGKGGGGSIALASVASTVMLQGCTLTTHTGGQGGGGGSGQPGQGGGSAGPSLAGGCPGAFGGNGAGGGGGAGGSGGISVCVVYSGSAPGGSSTCTTGDAGAGGLGGEGGAGGSSVLATGPSGNPGPPGLPGLAQPSLASP